MEKHFFRTQPHYVSWFILKQASAHQLSIHSPRLLLVAKASFGYSRYLMPHLGHLPLYSPTPSRGYAGSWSSELEALSIGNSWSRSPPSPVYEPSQRRSRERMPSSPEAQQRLTTSGRMTPESPTLNSSLGRNPFVVTPPPIGSPFGPVPSPAISGQYRPMSVWLVTAPFALLVPTLTSLKLLFDSVMFFGADLALESPDGPGMRLDWELTARIPDPNFGAATRVKTMLLSMSFVEVSTSPTSYDGLTVTRYALRSRAPRDLWSAPGSGSRRMLIR